MYIVDVGRAKGTFETVWGGSDNEGRDAGKADLRIVWDGEESALTETSVRVGSFSFGRGFGSRRSRRPFGDGPPPATLTLSGVRASDDKRLTFTLMAPRGVFEAGAGKSVAVNGWLMEGRGGGFGGFGRRGPGRSLHGEITLGAVGVSDGDPVTGSLDVSIMEMRGGMFGGRR